MQVNDPRNNQGVGIRRQELWVEPNRDPRGAGEFQDSASDRKPNGAWPRRDACCDLLLTFLLPQSLFQLGPHAIVHDERRYRLHSILDQKHPTGRTSRQGNQQQHGGTTKHDSPNGWVDWLL